MRLRAAMRHIYKVTSPHVGYERHLVVRYMYCKLSEWYPRTACHFFVARASNRGYVVHYVYRKSQEHPPAFVRYASLSQPITCCY